MTLNSPRGTATPTGVTRRGARSLRTLLVAAAVTTLFGLTACGDDSTVDNSQSEVAIPSVSESAKPSDSATEESGDAETSDSEASDRNNPAPAPEDSGAEEVESIPELSNRTPEDEDYLNKLREGGIDLGKVDAANAPGGIEDQLIAAARGFCQTEEAGSPDVFTALAAGQLKTQGVIDREPQELQPIIVDAARSAYCG
ncbi:DUF732 domain-containing protein [Corynebacterium urogenitale]